MLREVLSFLPDALVRVAPVVAAGCAALGVMLWLCGARYSLSILSLVAVAAGATIGMKLPAWRGWQIDGMGLAVGGALVLGAGAFLCHRTCIGALLAAGMMLWAGTGVWLFMGGDVYWDWRSVAWQGDMIQYARDCWQLLPPNLQKVFPAACFAGLIAGVSIAVYLPKLAKVLAHSLTGATLAAIGGAIFLNASRPDLLAWFPGSDVVQGVALIAIVLLGAAVQWRFTPPYRRAQLKATNAGEEAPE
ncbi:MAG TPA: hypothetical protein VGI81_25450 [Tepidisphaeraceae bacterium]|jgi:hypothetical protein